MKYSIYLENNLIGFTLFENADPSMGVVFGKIDFSEIEKPYKYFSDYCVENKITINENEKKHKYLSTQDIPGLKVISSDGKIIKGMSTSILGFDDDGYQIEILGIPYPEYSELFPQFTSGY